LRYKIRKASATGSISENLWRRFGRCVRLDLEFRKNVKMVFANEEPFRETVFIWL
jgi:hypothetical protein